MAAATEVSILNQTLAVETDTPKEDVERIIRYINKKVVDIQKQSGKASSLQVALLTCMNIAEDFLRYQKGKQEAIDLVQKKVQDLLEIVELQL